MSIYLDKFSTYKVNTKALADDPNILTQFERVMKEMGIRIIHAHSPQAKGRIERLNITLQDRLVKEMRLANISTLEQANRFVEKFIPQFNARFSVVAQKKGNLHQPLTQFVKENLDKIFSVKNTRIVNNDFTVKFKDQWFQLGPSQPCLILRKDKVQIEERIDGRLLISLRGKYLDYEVLPERPRKIKMEVVALAKTKPLWKPPADHPWRRSFLRSKIKVEEGVKE